MSPAGRLGIGLGGLLLAASILASSMAKPASRDEQMTCTAGVLLARGQVPYRDFAHPSQGPYHPLLCALAYRGLGGRRILLAGRFLSCLAQAVTLLAILLLYRRRFGAEAGRAGLGWGLLACVWIVFNPVADYAFGHAWNHDVVVACVMVAFLLLSGPAPPRNGTVVAAALLLGFAMWMRVTTVLVDLVCLLILCLWRVPRRRRLTWLGLWGGATLVVSLWPLWVIAQAPEAFSLNLFEIPRQYGQWLHEIGRYHPKGTLTRLCWSQPAMALLGGMALVLWSLAWVRRRLRWQAPALLALTLPVVFAVVALIPPTMWIQYWAIPVPFLVASLAWPLSVLARSGSGARRALAVTLGAVTALMVVLFPDPLVRLAGLTHPADWPPVALHRAARSLNARIAAPGRVLTLTPLWALEGGGTIYPELAAGSITYRIADRLSPAQRARTHVVGPNTLAACLGAGPPQAILVDCEEPYFRFLESPLRSLAGPDWRRLTLREGPTALLAP